MGVGVIQELSKQSALAPPWRGGPKGSKLSWPGDLRIEQVAQ